MDFDLLVTRQVSHARSFDSMALALRLHRPDLLDHLLRSNRYTKVLFSSMAMRLMYRLRHRK
jgi:hypothetical protein